jgi:uncharacterized protein YndB with AHSA1/START domain
MGRRAPVATNERFMDVPPQAVWDALADPGGYAYWVVGSKRIRDVEGEWPQPGSAFHHTIGVGPLTLDDHTVALEAEPPRRLKLRAKGRPVGTATVTMELEPRDGGTLVRMTENPDGVYAVMSLNPAVHLLTKYRNGESLMRLEELALRR